MPVLDEEPAEEEENSLPTLPAPPTPPIPPTPPTVTTPPADTLTLAVPTSSATDAPVTALRRYLDSMPQHPSPRKEVSSGAVWVAIRAEVIATFLMTITTSCVALAPPRPPLLAPCAQPVGVLSESRQESGWAWAMGHGLVMGGLSWAVRAAHLSPPTSIALLVTRKVSMVRAVLHLLAQVCGCLLAAPVLIGLLPRYPRLPQLAPHITPAQGWGAEFLSTVLVTLVSLSAYQTRAAKTTPLFDTTAALPITTAHVVAAVFCADYTGVGLNPARSLTLAVVTGAWRNHWVYWVGPTLGGVLAAFTHEYTSAKVPGGAQEPPQDPHLSRDTSKPSALTSSLASPC
ncbi:lens fiber major intrinsic protein-like [Portunus trituberculatus]|uniref:lens fiber major intrinsic protein-like n=1 Tax=Portunus trituberculatus TaxID=210409 RepID=UPI001E1CF3C8|nr:lens fiber major intrinsic protein-like [Portunus trituberculatus]